MRRALLLALALAAPSCSLLDDEVLSTPVPVVDENGQQTGTTTVGDVIADNAQPASQVTGSVVGTLTSNPILGATAAAAIAAMFGAARRKKSTQVVEQGD